MRKLALSIVLFLVPTFLSSQVMSRVRTHSQLGTCSKDGMMVVINDASAAGVCAAGGSSVAVCICDLSTTSWISQPVDVEAPDLSAYVLLAGDEDGQIIYGNSGNPYNSRLDLSGSATLYGNDGDSSLDIQQMYVNLSSGGDGRSTTVGATADDGGYGAWFQASVSDPLVPIASIGTMVSLSTNNEIKLDGSGISVATTSAGDDITLTAADSVILDPGGADGILSVTGDATFQTDDINESGYLFNARDSSGVGTTLDLSSGVGGTGGYITLDADDSYPEFTLASNSVTLYGAFRLTPFSAPPVACAGGTEGALYMDSDTHLLCVCNGTGWVQVADGTTGCS